MTQKDLLNAARHADWAQVVLNGGPPCFHYEANRGQFCLRAERWLGHHGNNPDHEFVSLEDLLRSDGSGPEGR